MGWGGNEGGVAVAAPRFQPGMCQVVDLNTRCREMCQSTKLPSAKVHSKTLHGIAGDNGGDGDGCG